jgi:hypothetical protein
MSTAAETSSVGELGLEAPEGELGGVEADMVEEPAEWCYSHGENGSKGQSQRPRTAYAF